MKNKNAIINSIPSHRTQRAIRNLIGVEEGESVPADGTAGYETGAEFTLKSPTGGQAIKWINQGSEGSSLFVPDGPSYGYSFLAAGAVAGTSGSTTETVGLTLLANSDIALAGHIKSDDDDYIASVAIADDDNEITITASADPLSAHGYVWAALRNKCTPSWEIFAAGTQACTAAATTAITVAGVLATDVAFACYQVTDDTDAIEKVVCSANTVTVSHSATSTTGHTVGYCVIRPRGTFNPSHYVYNAGSAVATIADAAGIATNAVTVSGALTTDVAFAVIHTQGGTIEIARAQVLADGTLTVQFSADPSTTSKFSWMLVRSY